MPCKELDPGHSNRCDIKPVTNVGLIGGSDSDTQHLTESSGEDEGHTSGLTSRDRNS